jgi:hypothetical protein
MSYIKSTTSFLRKAILLGWALAVVWIYMGNLVNFHQHHIWGKQLIPVACSSTRYKEEDTASVVKHDSNSKSFNSGLHFDFSAPDQQISDIPYFEIVSIHLNPTVSPVLFKGILAFSLRGPPSA